MAHAFREPYEECQQASDASMKCLMDTMQDRVKCEPYFEAYRECIKGAGDRRREKSDQRRALKAQAMALAAPADSAAAHAPAPARR